jgi:Lon protease-like protein
MFPLGTVLLPGAVLPLHVFEPRYRALTARCLDSGEEFGVTMIERGHEVGGGDVRSGIGCMAGIVDHEQFPDGRLALSCIGTGRIRVRRWLDDAPYPRAEVEPWPDPPPDDAAVEMMPGLELALRELLGQAKRRGLVVASPDAEMSHEPVAFSHEAATLIPVGSFDRQRLLEAPDARSRMELLGELLIDVGALITARFPE